MGARPGVVDAEPIPDSISIVTPVGLRIGMSKGLIICVERCQERLSRDLPLATRRTQLPHFPQPQGTYPGVPSYPQPNVNIQPHLSVPRSYMEYYLQSVQRLSMILEQARYEALPALDNVAPWQG